MRSRCVRRFGSSLSSVAPWNTPRRPSKGTSVDTADLVSSYKEPAGAGTSSLTGGGAGAGGQFQFTPDAVLSPGRSQSAVRMWQDLDHITYMCPGGFICRCPH